MTIYCMCKITGDVPAAARDSQGFGPPDGQCFQAPNRFSTVKDEITEDTGCVIRPVMLGQAMEVVRRGIPQERPIDGTAPPHNRWPKTKEEVAPEIAIFRDAMRLYPNVDMYRCRNCGTVVVCGGGA